MDRIGGNMKGMKIFNLKGKIQKTRFNKIKEKVKFMYFCVFLLVLIIALNSQGLSSDKEDLKIIKKVAKAEEFLISSKNLKEAKWLKICISEKKKVGKEDTEIRIYLPFLETILKSSKNCRIRNEKTEINLREIIQDLKRIGSMELFLLEDEESVIKIWLE